MRGTCYACTVMMPREWWVAKDGIGLLLLKGHLRHDIELSPKEKKNPPYIIIHSSF